MNNPMHLIRPGLWLGSRVAADNLDELYRCGVRRILTVANYCTPCDEVLSSVCDHLLVSIEDDVGSNLLEKFEECFNFIAVSCQQDHRDNNAVLVHCLAGRSRSATVVIAYLMATESITYHQALIDVRSKRMVVDPNDGFSRQLTLFEMMGSPWNINKHHQVYRGFLLSLVSQRVEDEFGDEKLHVVRREVPQLVMGADPQVSEYGSALYRCRKCRRALFTDVSLLQHMDKHVTDSTGSAQVCQLELFMEPVEWMRDVLLELQGKLKCPKCDAKLGTFSWVGVRCGCGSWVCPAIHVHKGKVDRRVISAPVVSVSQPAASSDSSSTRGNNS